VTSFSPVNCYHCFEGTYCLLLRVVKAGDDAEFLSSKKVQVKSTLEQTTKAHKGSIGIALLFL
jgi:hypothetical protein